MNVADLMNKLAVYGGEREVVVRVEWGDDLGDWLETNDVRISHEKVVITLGKTTDEAEGTEGSKEC